MLSDRETRIRERAHRLWEEEGWPKGKDGVHWDQATAEVDKELADEQAQARNPSDITDKTKGLP